MMMADERDLKLLDDYLANRMGEQDRTTFEQRLEADPDLQHEYALQKQLIQGIREARIAELKAMLNNVPVSPANSGNATASKIAIGAVATVAIAVAAYWFLREDATPQPVEARTEQPAPVEEPVVPQTTTEEPEQPHREPPRVAQQPVETDKNQTSAGTEHSKPSLARRPSPLSAPTDRAPDAPDATPDTGNDLAIPNSTSISVKTDRGTSRYTFHYQFREGKLFLFGPFDEAPYKVVELSADGRRTAFLFYQDSYYELTPTGEEIKPLTPVTDEGQIRKLDEVRTSVPE